jgi:hypothetical protein
MGGDQVTPGCRASFAFLPSTLFEWQGRLPPEKLHPPQIAVMLTVWAFLTWVTAPRPCSANWLGCLSNSLSACVPEFLAGK